MRGGGCLVGDTWKYLETVLIVTTREDAASIRWVEVRMLLNISQCKGQLLTTNPTQNVKSTKVEKL